MFVCTIIALAQKIVLINGSSPFKNCMPEWFILSSFKIYIKSIYQIFYEHSVSYVLALPPGDTEVNKT